MRTNESSQRILDQPCFQDENCNEPSCQDMIVERHDLKTGTEFLTMVRRYQDPVLAPREYTVQEIKGLMNGLDCTLGHHIRFTATDGGNNLGINLDPVKESIVGKYSLAFFKGLIRLHSLANDDVFEFYMARDTEGEVTLAMKVRVQQTDVYFGDLVGLYP